MAAQTVPLVSVLVVLQSAQPSVAALPHVVALVSDCLDYTRSLFWSVIDWQARKQLCRYCYGSMRTGSKAAHQTQCILRPSKVILKSSSGSTSTDRSDACAKAPIDSVAQNGYLDIVQRLHEKHVYGRTEKALDYSTASGHLDATK